MKYKSIWRAIRRGHLKWVADSISGQYGLYRTLRGGRLEYYGITMSAPTSECPIVKRRVQDLESGKTSRTFFSSIAKAIKGKE